MIRLAAAISLAFVLGAVNLATADAQNMPGGSYTSSCQNIRMNGDMITARCTAPNGAMIRSSTSAFCRGDIANNNGYLVCNGGGNMGRGNMGRGNMGGGYMGHRPGMGRGLPQGSYLASCTNARMDGRMLMAVCPEPNGARVETSLNTQYCRGGADIANRNGYLNCER